MSIIQVPTSIRKVASEVTDLVLKYFPHYSCLEDFPIAVQNKWENTCDHELFYQDVNRFIGDVYAKKSRE